MKILFRSFLVATITALSLFVDAPYKHLKFLIRPHYSRVHYISSLYHLIHLSNISFLPVLLLFCLFFLTQYAVLLLLLLCLTFSSLLFPFVIFNILPDFINIFFNFLCVYFDKTFAFLILVHFNNTYFWQNDFTKSNCL